MKTAVGRTLTIAELYYQPPLMPMLAFTAGVLHLPDSTAFQYAKEGRLPVELVRVGRKRYVRTADVIKWLGLPQKDDSARDAAPAPSVEHTNESTAQQIGARS